MSLYELWGFWRIIILKRIIMPPANGRGHFRYPMALCKDIRMVRSLMPVSTPSSICSVEVPVHVSSLGMVLPALSWASRVNSHTCWLPIFFYTVSYSPVTNVLIFRVRAPPWLCSIHIPWNRNYQCLWNMLNVPALLLILPSTTEL